MFTSRLTPRIVLTRVLPLALLSVSALLVLAAPFSRPATARVAGPSCWASADTHVISVSAGGTQTIAVRTNGLSPVGAGYRVLGSFSGTSPGSPFFSTFVPLNVDRYFVRLYSVGSPFVPGGNQGALDANGNALVQIVIPPGAPSWLIGTTVHHAIAPQQLLAQQPYCSSAAIPLTFVP